MSELGELLKDTVLRLFSQEVSREFLYTYEDGSWAAELWELADEMELCTLLLPEDEGGSGGDWDDAYEIVKTCGRYAVPLPVPETMLARWLVSQSGAEQPQGAGTLMLSAEKAERVPWGRSVAWGVAMPEESGNLLVVSLVDAVVARNENIAKEPRDVMNVADSEVVAAKTALPADTIFYLGAMLRSAQLAGAALALTERTVQYASERVQFGRPLSKMQAVQQNIAQLASATASMDAVSRSAFRRFQTMGFSDQVESDSRVAIAAAKYRASECAEAVCRIAHQVHGAIGFTHEHDLHFFTRRVWSWRGEFGHAGYWASKLGDLSLSRGAGGTWDMVTSCSDSLEQAGG